MGCNTIAVNLRKQEKGKYTVQVYKCEKTRKASCNVCWTARQYNLLFTTQN